MHTPITYKIRDIEHDDDLSYLEFVFHAEDDMETSGEVCFYSNISIAFASMLIEQDMLADPGGPFAQMLYAIIAVDSVEAARKLIGAVFE